MSFSSGESRLIELPTRSDSEPEEEDDSSMGKFFEANSPESLMESLGLDDELAHRILLKDEIFFHYKILKFIGQGGMSDVYVAQHLDEHGTPSSSRPVALKILRENQYASISLLSLLEREAEICHALKSPHVVRIYEYGLSQTGQAFMALELLKGEELFERRKRQKILPLKELAEIACQVLQGLEALHDLGVVHRDLKTENIFIVRQRQGREIAKIIDLGLARYIADDPGDPLLLDTQRIWGTPHYLSPEQTRSPVVDHRSDIYSLGIILYECATGAYPFDGETPYAIMLDHQEKKPPLMPSTLDFELCEIVYKALAKNPSDRWQSARDMRLALETWIDSTSWDNALPGAYHIPGASSSHDNLFADLLASSSTGDLRESGNLLPVDPIDRFGSQPVKHHTPMLDMHSAEAAYIKKRLQAELPPQDSLLEEPGQVPESARSAQSPVLRATPSSGSQPALRMPDRSTPLHSSPIELAQTKKKPASQSSELISQPLRNPVPAPLPETLPAPEGRTALLAMVCLGVGLLLALILLLVL